MCPMCPMCDGEGAFLGVLGRRAQYRCIDCGMVFSHTASDAEQAAVAEREGVILDDTGYEYEINDE